MLTWEAQLFYIPKCHLNTSSYSMWSDEWHLQLRRYMLKFLNEAPFFWDCLIWLSLSLLEWAEVVFNGLLNVRHLIALSGIDACAGPYKNSQDRRGAELCHHIPSQKTFEEGRTEHTSTLNWGRGQKTVSERENKELH